MDLPAREVENPGGRLSGEPADPRGRIAIAAGAAVALTAIVVVVSVASGGGSGDEREQVIAAPRCLEAWNSDAAARSYGRHNFSYHLYKGALVTFLDETGVEVGADGDGLCAVIFPSQVLDPEPIAAGEVLRGERWLPISSLDGIELNRVAELQVLAAGAPNTTLDVRGVLAAL